MPSKTWKMIDHSAGVPVQPHWEIREKDLPGLGKAGVIKRTYHGGVAEGVVALEINNGKLQIDVLPTRGMGIWRVLPLDDRELSSLGWKSPVRGPVNPSFVNLGEPSGLGWLDGFDELLVRCGLESNGAPDFDDQTNRLKYPLHGRIANRPAHAVSLTIDTDKKEMTLVGVVEESRFHGQKLRLTSTLTTKFDATSFTIRDEVENFSDVPATMQLLYHVNFGVPLLDAGSQVVVAAKQVAPRNDHAATGLKNWNSYPAPEPGFEEMVYFLDLNAAGDGKTRALLKNAHSTRGVSLIWSKLQLPYFTIWKDTGGENDGYVTGLEPGTNFPNPRSFETVKNRVVKLKPGESKTFDLAMEIHLTPEDIGLVETAIAEIQGGRQPKVFEEPQSAWSA
jgi:galactose mutarotase-like enzyme